MEKPNKCTELDKEISLAPVEILTEFLSSIMLHDYESALIHCSQILTHEPENPTAKEFYPLILKKLEIARSEEHENISDSDDSTYSASDSSSFHRDTDNINSSPSSSESDLSFKEADDKRSSKKKTVQTHVKEEVIFPSISQNQKNTLKALPKKELQQPPHFSARALSTSESIYGTRTIKGDGKPKINYKEFSSLKTGVKKIENLGHLPKDSILERRTRTNDSKKEKSFLHTKKKQLFSS